MKRLYIENSPINEKEVLTNAQRAADLKGLPEPKTIQDFFTYVIGEALSNGEKIWKAIQECDEIYMDTALIPMFGVGGGTLFNNFMCKAIACQMTRKKLYFLTYFPDIWWNELDEHLVSQTLGVNQVYTFSEDGNSFQLARLKKILNEY